MDSLVITYLDLMEKKLIITHLIKIETDEKILEHLTEKAEAVMSLLRIVTNGFKAYCEKNSLVFNPDQIEKFVQDWIDTKRRVA